MRSWLSGITALVVFFLAFATAIAQNATTSVRGVITDPTGAGVPKAIVELSNPTLGFHTTGTANGRGEYSFQQLTPGDYTITVSAAGFGNTVLHATLQVGQPAKANATLSVQSANGYFNIDAGLHKVIHLNDRMFFNLAWEVFNVTNSARFDVHSAYSSSTDGPQLGEYTGLLGLGAFHAPPTRRMQLSGRFEF